MTPPLKYYLKNFIVAGLILLSFICTLVGATVIIYGIVGLIK